MGKGIVIGLDKVIGKLNDLPKDIQRDVDNVLAEGANDVVNLSRHGTVLWMLKMHDNML